MATLPRWQTVNPANVPNLNPNAGFAVANQGFSNILKNKRLKEKIENEKIFQDARVSQQQQQLDFNLAAPERAEAERERQRQEEIAKSKIVSDVMNSRQFEINPGTEAAMRAAPGMTQILDGVARQAPGQHPRDNQLLTPQFMQGAQKQNSIVQGFKDQMIANPELWRDPDRITREIGKAARSQGFKSADVKLMQQQGLEDFKVVNPEIAKLQLGQLSEGSKNRATIIAAALKSSGGSRAGSTLYNGINKRPKQGDANLRSNLESYTENLKAMGASDEASLMTKALDWINPANDTDVTRANASPIFTFLAERGVGFPAALQVLEGRGHLAGGEWKNGFFSGGKTGNELLENTDEMQALIEAGTRIQNGNSGTTANSGSADLTSALSLSDSLQAGSITEANKIFSSMTPRQRSGAERTQLGLNYLAEQTGVKPTFAAPSKTQKNSAKKDFVDVPDVADDKTTTNKVVPDTILSDPTGKYDNSFIEDQPGYVAPTATDDIFNNTSALPEKTEAPTSLLTRLDNQANQKRKNAEIQRDQNFNERRWEILGIGSNPNMKDTGTKKIVSDDYESNFYTLSPNDKRSWFRSNKDGLSQGQQKEAKAIIAADKEAANGLSLAQILKQ